ncbi:AAA family ATPase [Nocardioides zeae]|uniref:26S protease regulatory subunit n=1 Tax=Nocardioides zeae TaxID=1457234 RepID=A0A6P0HHM5_9ACTN|nr:ATP-binding protein [Nocardioides zeae]NEN78192.1 26S protease regulatory subunit [Nocardioides zeae]
MPDQDAFIDAFARFLDRVVHDHERRTSSDPGELVRILDAHLGTPAADCSIVTEKLPPWRLVDADVVMESMADAAGRVLGLSVDRRQHDVSFRSIVAGRHGAAGIAPVDHVTMPIGPGEERRVVSRGLRLLTWAGEPVAVLQSAADPEWNRQEATLEVVGARPATVDAFLAEVRRRMTADSVLRGQVMTFRPHGFESMLGGVAFVERPSVARDDVVLPDGAFERLEQHVLALGVHREALLAAGQHLKRGVLLYGPPGTGKTHTVRHLVGAAAGTTVLMLSGNSLGAVREAASIARVLEPAIVVLEDCDLIAEDRDMMGSPDSLLFELLEALDGLDGDADVAFLLTTNRPDLLEQALAQRPGRIDLAIEVPRPDAAARRRLFALYARSLDLSDAAVDAAADRAEGVTASFAKELVRRTVLAAAVEGVPVADRHLEEALDELLGDRESFTRSLLASGPATHEDEALGPRRRGEVGESWLDEEGNSHVVLGGD